jgi:hypothetical protein
LKNKSKYLEYFRWTTGEQQKSLGSSCYFYFSKAESHNTRHSHYRAIHNDTHNTY